jgi:hypothetical protein
MTGSVLLFMIMPPHVHVPVPASPMPALSIRLRCCLAATLAFLGTALAPAAAPLHVPNANFEFPATVFADPRIDAWQKSPKPEGYDESGGFPWDQLTGVFLNTPADKPDHIVNMQGSQAVFLFAVPQVALFQDRLSPPAGAFDVLFEPGHAYRLTVGVLGGGGGMKPGVTLELALYYRDASGLPVPVASTTVTNDTALFPNTSRFVDFSVVVPTVRRSDAWAGQPLGIRIASTVAPELAGGYWDVEDVRLTRDILVPNGSFELPSTVFADPRVDSWQKSPKPDWYDESGGFTWEQLSGVFLNTAPDAADHILNLDGKQAVFLFAVPQAELFQDAESTTTAEFDTSFAVGRTYQLTAGILGGGGGMKSGVTLGMSLYFRDPAGQRVTVASTTITHSPEIFPTLQRVLDFSVQTPPVSQSSPWAGKSIGVAFTSTVRPDLAGGYWDIDHVRLSEMPLPHLGKAAWRDGTFSVELTSPPNSRVEFLASPALNLPIATWTSLGTVTNTTGTMVLTDRSPGPGPRFYSIRQLP